MLALRKLLVSGFVVSSFVAYVVHDRLGMGQSTNDGAPTNDGAQVQVMNQQQVLPTVQQNVPSSQHLAPTSVPQQQIFPTNPPPSPTTAPVLPTATTKPQGKYQDGTYTGPVVDAFYGLVQVQAIVQNGRLSDVQFLKYPNDRRTSQRINSIAMPYLTQEAIQAQSAYINIISGATLTSEAFAMSLNNALNQAAV